MVSEDLVNLMEDDVSAKEAIDVKEKKSIQMWTWPGGKKGGGANVIKERKRSAFVVWCGNTKH